MLVMMVVMLVRVAVVLMIGTVSLVMVVIGRMRAAMLLMGVRMSQTGIMTTFL